MKLQSFIPCLTLTLLLMAQFVPGHLLADEQSMGQVIHKAEQSSAPAPGTKASPYQPPVMSEEQLKNYPFDSIEASYSIRDLTPGQSAVLARWRREARNLFARKLGILNINGTEKGLKAMQQLIDSRLIKAHQTELWQSLGVVFGDILARKSGMHWVSYEDDLGVSKVLRWRETENFIFPISVFSKRIRFGKKINVFDLFAKMEKEVAAFKAYALRPQLPHPRKPE